MPELPNDQNAERSILGAIMLDDKALTATSFLSPADFWGPQHRAIFGGMRELEGKSIAIDAVTLTEQLRVDGALERVGGPAYIAGLDASMATAANAAHHGRIVAELALRRRVIDLAKRTLALAADDETETEELVGGIQRDALELGAVGAERISSARELALEAMAHVEAMHERPEDVRGVSTGLVDFDRMTGGLQKAELVIVAARPSMGKTAWCLNIAANAALHDVPAAVFSLEMSRRALGLRLVSSEARIAGSRLRSGRVGDDEWEHIAAASNRLSAAPLWVDDSSSPTVFDLRAGCRKVQAKARRPLGLVVVDYLQLVRAGKAESREQAVSEVTRGLKARAKDLNAPVVALSQLSRALEKRDDKRPMLSDLRESGSIEQEADLVAFIHREDYYDGRAPRGVAEIIVAKQRNGPTGTIKAIWHEEFTRFEGAA